MVDDCDSVIQGCLDPPECRLAILASKGFISSGETVDLTATGANGGVEWVVIIGESALNTMSGNSVILTGGATAETAVVYAIDSLNCIANIEIPVCNATIQSQTVATSPSNRARVKIGVGEEVDLTASQGSSTWAITSGDGTLTPDSGRHQQVRFTAGESAGNVTITATGNPCTSTITFEVVEPTDFTMRRKSGTRVLHGGLNAASGAFLNILVPDCGWLGVVCVHPNDVNFYRLRFREQDCRSHANGSYNPSHNNQLHGGPSYTANGGYSSWIPLGRHTEALGSLFGAAGIEDNIYSGWSNNVARGSATPPFIIGYYYWDILCQWKVGRRGAIRNFPVIRQDISLRANGRCTINKAGHSEHADFNSPLQSW